uniref:Uncharacterized protein n=1 Tax=Cacopsylla melanoneura TaxID=428564 RepID=A0A8D8ZLH4_9HEMI
MYNETFHQVASSLSHVYSSSLPYVFLLFLKIIMCELYLRYYYFILFLDKPQVKALYFPKNMSRPNKHAEILDLPIFSHFWTNHSLRTPKKLVSAVGPCGCV